MSAATAYWCKRGGLFTLIHAPDVVAASKKAARAMNRPRDGIVCRPATARDRALWAQLLEQQAGGALGCMTERELADQPELFAA